MISGIMGKHSEILFEDFENTKKGLNDVLEECRAEWNNNQVVMEVIEKIQNAALKQLTQQQQKMVVECNHTTQKLQKLKYSVGPILDDLNAVPLGSNLPMLVQWVWNDDKGRFIPYDTQTTILIENQYQKTPNGTVKLSHGFFGKNWISYAEHKRKMYDLKEKLKANDTKKPKK